MQLIDTHVHLNFDVFQSDLEDVSHRWREAGVVRLIHSCVEPSEFEEIQVLAARFPEVYFAVGLHPLDAHKWTAEFEDIIPYRVCSNPKVIALGEMGLDFYKANNLEQQKAVFIAQLFLAEQLNLPIIIHCRDAAKPMAELLQDFWKNHQPLSGVMHCWSGTPEETQCFLDLGLYISFSGIVTFKNANQIQAAARMVPRDRILIETDCPFLSPVPRRGKRNEPAYVSYVAEKIAQLRCIDVDNLAAQTTENACKLFGLSLSPLSPQ